MYKKAENDLSMQNEFMNVGRQQKALHNLKRFIFLISGDGSRPCNMINVVL